MERKEEIGSVILLGFLITQRSSDYFQLNYLGPQNQIFKIIELVSRISPYFLLIHTWNHGMPDLFHKPSKAAQEGVLRGDFTDSRSEEEPNLRMDTSSHKNKTKRKVSAF